MPTEEAVDKREVLMQAQRLLAETNRQLEHRQNALVKEIQELEARKRELLDELDVAKITLPEQLARLRTAHEAEVAQLQAEVEAIRQDKMRADQERARAVQAREAQQTALQEKVAALQLDVDREASRVRQLRDEERIIMERVARVREALEHAGL